MAKGREHKPHIGIFGKRNSGKSSFINALSQQDVAIVSSFMGTTADPVKKSIEIKGVGPCVLIDTAGIDDEGELGALRIKRTLRVLKQIDMAVLLMSNNFIDQFEHNLAERFKKAAIPFFVVHNKSDQNEVNCLTTDFCKQHHCECISFCSLKPDNLKQVSELFLKTVPPTAYQQKSLLGEFVEPNDLVVLVTPIDTEAPQGRLILPQVQAIRDTVDNVCVAAVVREDGLEHFLDRVGIKPKIVITDTQAILQVSKIVPPDVLLTGFSVLLAKYKGDFDRYLKGTPAIGTLNDGDSVLMLESCTHFVTCDDIGRYKLPRWITDFTQKQLDFEAVSGFDDIKKNIDDYSLVIQCGACMITPKQLKSRLQPAIDAGIPVSNYGMAIAYTQGLFERVIEPFVNIQEQV